MINCHPSFRVLMMKCMCSPSLTCADSPTTTGAAAAKGCPAPRSGRMAVSSRQKHAKATDVSGLHMPHRFHRVGCMDQPLLRGHVRWSCYTVRGLPQFPIVVTCLCSAARRPDAHEESQSSSGSLYVSAIFSSRNCLRL